LVYMTATVLVAAANDIALAPLMTAVGVGIAPVAYLEVVEYFPRNLRLYWHVQTYGYLFDEVYDTKTDDWHDIGQLTAGLDIQEMELSLLRCCV
jgi:hypothetical protein